MRLIVLRKDKIVKAKENTKKRMEYKEIVKGTFYMQKQIFFSNAQVESGLKATT